VLGNILCIIFAWYWG